MEKYRTIWITLLQWGLLWTVVIGCSLAWNRHLVTEHIIKHAREEAATVINKDLAFRRWATMHGGVYVPPTEKTPPNQWLSVPKRDVVTTDGDRLTLMNPAYMTRQVMELFGDQYGIKGRITSLIAKNPVNAPDPWERDALIRLEKGEKTVGTLADIEGEPYYRLILPMRMEQGCLKCHADTKIPVGGLRGGISAAVPMTPHHQAAVTSMRGVNLAYGAIWLVGMLGITTVSLYNTVSSSVNGKQKKSCGPRRPSTPPLPPHHRPGSSRPICTAAAAMSTTAGVPSPVCRWKRPWATAGLLSCIRTTGSGSAKPGSSWWQARHPLTLNTALPSRTAARSGCWARQPGLWATTARSAVMWAPSPRSAGSSRLRPSWLKTPCS
jgi:hypothetical protein